MRPSSSSAVSLLCSAAYARRMKSTTCGSSWWWWAPTTISHCLVDTSHCKEDLKEEIKNTDRWIEFPWGLTIWFLSPIQQSGSYCFLSGARRLIMRILQSISICLSIRCRTDKILGQSNKQFEWRCQSSPGAAATAHQHQLCDLRLSYLWYLLRIVRHIYRA